MIVNRYIDVRVVGNSDEIDDFLELCRAIQYLGSVGASRELRVYVDGDGSGRLSFYAEGNILKYKDGIDENSMPKFHIGE